MDSGSGSMQSSSGGDDESYDSRAESISALLGPAITNHHHPPQVLQQQQQQLHHPHRQHQHQVEFDSLSNMLDSRLANNNNNNPNNPLLNLDMVWSNTLRSDPSMADLGGHNDLSQTFLTNSQLGRQVSTRVSGGGVGGVGRGPSTFTYQIPSSSSAPNDQANNNVGGIRNSNPKKWSRASRRAPTTVLTTDTSNFRAMVQEFTGIPAPPFLSISPFARTRLDLFAGSSNSSFMAGRSGQNHMDPASSSLPPYLLRPFAHRPPLLPSHPPSSNNSSTTSNIGGGGSNLQYSQSPLLNMNNMQNSPSSPSLVLNFQSLFRPQKPNLPKYPSPVLGSSKSQGSLGVPEDQFGLSHGLNNVQLPNIVFSDGGRMTVQARHDSYPTTTSTMNWVDNNSNNMDDGIVDHQHLLRSVNYAAASSSLNVEKAGVQENNVTNTTATTTTTARSEGMVESWICSSD